MGLPSQSRIRGGRKCDGQDGNPDTESAGTAKVQPTLKTLDALMRQLQSTNGPPWPYSRKTNNPRKANRSRRTTLQLIFRIRNMRFMLTTDTLYRVATRLSHAPAMLISGIFHHRAPSRTTTSGIMSTSPDISDLRLSRVKGGNILLRQDSRPSSGSGGVFGSIRR